MPEINLKHVVSCSSEDRVSLLRNLWQNTMIISKSGKSQCVECQRGAILNLGRFCLSVWIHVCMFAIRGHNHAHI